jgi:hypothetical protein
MAVEKKEQFCGSPDHGINRRIFLKGGVATALGVSLGGLEAGYDMAWAEELKKRKRQVLLLWLAGGASQLETFDPKPGRPTGGPFKAIPTAVPGVHICELMPKLAAIMDRIAVVRSLDTRVGDHGGATTLIETGRGRQPGIDFPELGTVLGKELAQRDGVPEYVSLYLATEGEPRPAEGALGARPHGARAPARVPERAVQSRAQCSGGDGVQQHVRAGKRADEVGQAVRSRRGAGRGA